MMEARAPDEHRNAAPAIRLPPVVFSFFLSRIVHGVKARLQIMFAVQSNKNCISPLLDSRTTSTRGKIKIWVTFLSFSYYYFRMISIRLLFCVCIFRWKLIFIEKRTKTDGSPAAAIIEVVTEPNRCSYHWRFFSNSSCKLQQQSSAEQVPQHSRLLRGPSRRRRPVVQRGLDRFDCRSYFMRNGRTDERSDVGAPRVTKPRRDYHTRRPPAAGQPAFH